jgi:hypothetical protein
MNLRTTIATAPNSTTGYTNSDYVTGGGICISCHSSEMTKSTTAVKTETNSTKTMIVADTDFSGTSHNYNVTSTMTNGGATFNANCSKCHDAQNNDGQTFQNSANKFGIHDDTLRRLLASLGITSPADPEEEDFCYRCHSKTTDTTPGGGPAKGTANMDYYNTTAMNAASQDIFTAMQLGTAGSPASTVSGSVLYFRNSAPSEPMDNNYNLTSGTYTGATTFNSYLMSPGSAGTAQTSYANTTTSTTNPRYMRMMQFISMPINSAVTLTAGQALSITLMTQESNINFNGQVRYALWKWNANDTLGTNFVAAMNYASAPTPPAVPELGDGVANTPATQTWSFTVGTTTTFNAGDKILLEMEVYRPSTTNATATFYWNGSEAANLTLPTSVTFTVPATPASGRHDVAQYSGLHKPSPTDETRGYIASNKHVECDDCHNPHAAKAGNHTITDPFPGVSGNKFYFLNTAPSSPPSVKQTTDTITAGTWNWYNAGTSLGSGTATKVINITTTTSGANYAGVCWLSPALSAGTIPAGTYAVNIYGQESNTGANQGLKAYLFIWKADNTKTQLSAPVTTAAELGTTKSLQTISIPVASATTVGAGDRLAVEVYSYSRSAPSATTYTTTLSFNGNVAGTDDSNISFAPTPSGTMANVLTGVSGVGVTTWNATSWGGVTTYNPSTTTAALITATAEWQICFKCHSGANANYASWGGSGAAAWTDLGLEFNPNNESYHPVVQALPSTGNRQLAAAALTGGWAPGSVMTCSDCHATDSAASKGPHGSSVKWMLNPTTTGTKYYNWPYTSAANNGTSTGTFLTGTGSATVPNTGQIFCLSCHVWSGGGAAHTNQGGNHSVACVSCHIRVPHGGKVLRLLTGALAPARYYPDGNGGGTVDMDGGVRPATGTMGRNDCNNTPTGCNQHNAGGQNW